MEPKIGYELYEQMTFGGVEPSYWYFLRGLPSGVAHNQLHGPYPTSKEAEVAAKELLRMYSFDDPVRLQYA